MSNAPFVGLRPFGPEDRSLFYGRDEQIDELLERLEKCRFLAVVGLSGTGKSSLVIAGLIPALYRGALETVGSHWRIEVIRPSRKPIETLAKILDTTDAWKLLRMSSLGLVEWADKILRAEETLLVVVDQFEDIFRDSGADANPEEDLAFVRLLLEGTRSSTSRVFVVITIRADFLGACGRFSGLPEILNGGQYLVPRLTRDQMRDAIEKPVQAAGAAIEPALVTHLINETADDPTQLPALQHALLRLWDLSAKDRAEGKEIGFTHYNDPRIESVSKAIDHHAEEVLANYDFDPARMRIARMLFQRITQKNETGQLTRRRTTLKEIWLVTLPRDVTNHAEHRKKVREVIEDFRSEGVTFLMPRQPERLVGDSLIDISHETLMLHWKTLQNWIAMEAEDARLYRRFSEYAADHEAGLRDLLVGTELRTARDWLKKEHNKAWADRYPGDLKATRDFILRSERKAHADLKRKREEEWEKEYQARRQKRQATIIGAFAIVIILLLLVSIVAAFKWIAAERQGKLVLSHQLEAQASEALRTGAGPELPALLAIESIDRQATPSNSALLRDIVALLAKRILLLTGKSPVTSCAFSRNDELIAFGTASGHIQVSALTGQTILSVDRPGSVERLRLADEAPWIVTANNEGQNGASSQQIHVIVIGTGQDRCSFQHSGRLVEWGLSIDGQSLTIAGIGSGDKLSLQTFDTATGKVSSTQTFRAIDSFSLSRDGSAAAWVSDGAARYIRANSAGPYQVLANTGVTGVALSPKGERVALASGGGSTGGGTLLLLDLRYGNSKVWSVEVPSVRSLNFTSTGNAVTVTTADGTTRSFDVLNGGQVWYHKSEGARTTASPDGTWAITEKQNQISVYDTASDSEVSRIESTAGIADLALSTNHIAMGSPDGSVQVYNSYPSDRVTRIPTFRPFLVSLLVSRDGRFVKPSPEKLLRIVRADTGREVIQIIDSCDLPRFSTDSRYVACVSKDDKTSLFDLATGRQLPVDERLPFAFQFAFSPDNFRYVAVTDKGVEIIDTHTWQNVASFQSADAVNWVGFSPDGRWIQIQTRSRTNQASALYRADNGHAVPYPSTSKNAWPPEIAFSANGQWCIAGGQNGASLISLAQPPLSVMRNLDSGSAVVQVGFSPDSKLLFTTVNPSASETASDLRHRVARIYGTETGKFLYKLNSMTTNFSPHGRWLVARDLDGARLYQPATGKLVTSTTADVYTMMWFSDDELTAFVENIVSHAVITTHYLLDTDSLVKQACSLLPRNLSKDEWEKYLGKEPYKKTCPNLN